MRTTMFRRLPVLLLSAPPIMLRDLVVHDIEIAHVFVMKGFSHLVTVPVSSCALASQGWRVRVRKRSRRRRPRTSWLLLARRRCSS